MFIARAAATRKWERILDTEFDKISVVHARDAATRKWARILDTGFDKISVFCARAAATRKRTRIIDTGFDKSVCSMTGLQLPESGHVY